MVPTRLKKVLILLLKVTISVALLAYLFDQARDDKSFATLRDQPKNWPLLAGALALSMMGVLLTFFRWQLLVRALGLPFGVKDAFRLGFLGYLFNFISLGSVGGDLFKAIFLAREHHSRKTEAVATVIVDRIVGLYALFVVASGGIVSIGFQSRTLAPEVRIIINVTLVCTAVGAVALLVLVVPGFTRGIVSTWLGGLPGVGPISGKLIAAIRIYRRKFWVMLWSMVMSLGVHVLFTGSLYLIARGLYGDKEFLPTLAEHFLIIPLSMLAGALPLPLAGLGAVEVALDFLYRQFADGGQVASGFVVALCYRVITVLIALFGVCYWLTSRREVAEAIHEAEELE